MNAKFTPKETKFVDQMVQFCGKKTASQCAADSGFGVRGARTRASELMARSEIRNEIDLRLEELRQKWKIDKETHIKELWDLKEMAKETKNVNAAVRAEELRGKCIGLYIDRQIIASAELIALPDGTMKAKQELTEEDTKKLLEGMIRKHKIITSHANKNNSKMKK